MMHSGGVLAGKRTALMDERKKYEPWE